MTCLEKVKSVVGQGHGISLELKADISILKNIIGDTLQVIEMSNVKGVMKKAVMRVETRKISPITNVIAVDLQVRALVATIVS